jgi:hypothetical protein
MTIELTGYQRPRRLASTSRLSTMNIEGRLTFNSVPARTTSPLVRWPLIGSQHDHPRRFV